MIVNKHKKKITENTGETNTQVKWVKFTYFEKKSYLQENINKSLKLHTKHKIL
jgi:hypothetical protein